VLLAVAETRVANAINWRPSNCSNPQPHDCVAVRMVSSPFGERSALAGHNTMPNAPNAIALHVLLPRQDNFAELLASLQACISLCGPFGRVALIDDRSHASGAEKCCHLPKLLVASHRGTQDSQLIPEDPGQVGYRIRARGCPGGEVDPSPGQG